VNQVFHEFDTLIQKLIILKLKREYGIKGTKSKTLRSIFPSSGPKLVIGELP